MLDHQSGARLSNLPDDIDNFNNDPASPYYEEKEKLYEGWEEDWTWNDWKEKPNEQN